MKTLALIAATMVLAAPLAHAEEGRNMTCTGKRYGQGIDMVGLCYVQEPALVARVEAACPTERFCTIEARVVGRDTPTGMPRTYTVIKIYSVGSDAVPTPLPRPKAGATIPDDYRGEWCEHNQSYYRQRRTMNQPCERWDVGYVRITATAFESLNGMCRLLQVKPGQTPTGWIGDLLTFDCHFSQLEADDRGPITRWFATTAGRTPRLYIEDLDQ